MLTPISNALGVIDKRGYMVDAGTSRDDPLAWLYRLHHRLLQERVGRILMHPDGSYEQRYGLTTLDAYYSGNHPLPEVQDKETQARFLEFMRRSKSNYMQTVVDSETQRLRWQGVRVGSEAEATPDAQTWDIMQENGVDSLFPLAAQVALTQRRAYWSVWYPGKGQTGPQIALEDPCQTIVEHAAGDRRIRLAGLKVWIDEWDGAELANVYLPNWTYKYRWDPGTNGRPSGWYEREAPTRNPLGVVPIIPMVNRPTLSLDPDGRSELDALIAIQNRINQTVLNRQVAEHHSAFRQKWATGMSIPLDEDGEPIATFKSAIDSFWVNTNPDGRWGEFEATNLANYNTAKESDVQDIAIISATPRHYFTVNGQAPSGDSMKSAEAALVAKCIDFQTKSGNPALKELVQLTRKISELPALEVQPIWGDPEYQTFGQLVDGTLKLVESRIVSRKYAREQIGMSPTDAARVEVEVQDEMAVEQAAQERLMAAQPDPAVPASDPTA